MFFSHYRTPRLTACHPTLVLTCTSFVATHSYTVATLPAPGLQELISGKGRIMAKKKSRGSHKLVVNAATAIKKLRTREATIPIVLRGKIVNGKVQIDQDVLDDIARKYPNANGSFIAVNAPFDPKGLPAAQA